MAWRIGVDIGGTFTDVALVDDASGRIGVAKVLTTPRDLAEGVLSALQTAMQGHAIAPADVGLLAHATTVVTNAILEEKGARAALVTTRGFGDVLELRRSARGNLYDLFQDAPATLIPRRRRFEITERIGADGAIVTPLAETEIEALIADLKAANVQAVAVCLLFSFLNAAHEKRLGARLRAALPGISVYLSSEVLPEIREFERTSTTAVCAYVGPILASYLERLEGATRGQGLPRLYVMGSNGGILEAAETVAMPAMAVESGPAAGVVAAALVARQTGHLDLLSFDMGGTTAKASLIRNGQYETTPEYEVGGGASGNRWMHGTGHPIRVPVIDLAEVSAGGGSIAWVDRAGSLRVGPKSAGAEPGPVCYGRGGCEPTVTDCNLLLGYLDKGSLLAGDLPIDHAAAEAAVTERLAKPLGVDARTAAAAVIDVVNHAMAEALKIVSVQRGHDPRAFVLGGIRRRRAAARGSIVRGTRHRPRHLPADSRRVLGARPGRQRPEARLRAHRLHHHRHSGCGGHRGRVRRAGARGHRHAGSRRRGAGAPALRAQHRRQVRAAVLRAGRRRSRPGARRSRLARRGRGLPRSPQAHLRPRQPRRAGAARQPARDGDRRHSDADHPYRNRRDGR